MGSNVGPNFASNLLECCQSCTFHVLFQLAWDEGFKRSCLDVFIKSCCRQSARFTSFVSADHFVPFLESRGKVLQFACRTSALRFPPLRGSQRRAKSRSTLRPDAAAPRTMSKLSLSVEAGSATWTCSLFSKTPSMSSSHSEPNYCSSASFVITLS